jgi:hypothetical protein
LKIKAEVRTINLANKEEKMRNRILSATMIVVTCAWLLGLGALNVAAQMPLNDSPWFAIYTHGEPRPIPAQTTLWFKFLYGSKRKPVEIVLPLGRAIGLKFEVYTTDLAAHYWEVQPIGRSSAPMVPCDTGTCQSDHLQWKGTFPSADMIYVAVINPNDRWVTMQLGIRGEDVTIGPGVPVPGAPTDTPTPTVLPRPEAPPIAPPPPVVPPAAPPAGPTPTPTVVKPENDSPYTARSVRDNRDESIPSTTSLWYRFDHGGDRSQILIVLPNGVNLGLDFRVYTPEQAAAFTDGKFVGRGTAGNKVCDTGKCSSNDLSWVGNFSAPGTYFIEVVNPTLKEAVFRLHMEGTNITIGD